MATRCHITRLKCTKFYSRRLSVRPSVSSMEFDTKCMLVGTLYWLTLLRLDRSTVAVNWRFSYNMRLGEMNCSVVCRCRVLVGAPRDNVTYGWSVNVERPGAVYSCPLTSLRDDCTQLTIDYEGSNVVKIEWKSHLNAVLFSQLHAVEILWTPLFYLFIKR